MKTVATDLEIIHALRDKLRIEQRVTENFLKGMILLGRAEFAAADIGVLKEALALVEKAKI